MNENRSLLQILIDFFDLPPGTRPEEIQQAAIHAWDSLTMVQLIAELEKEFGIRFEIHEIERLRSYAEIRETLKRRKKPGQEQ